MQQALYQSLHTCNDYRASESSKNLSRVGETAHVAYGCLQLRVVAQQ